jgi:hypothetical protein
MPVTRLPYRLATNGGSALVSWWGSVWSVGPDGATEWGLRLQDLSDRYVTEIRLRSHNQVAAAALGVSVVLPVLSVAVEEPDRLRYMLQRMIEVAFILSTFLVLVVFILAEPVLELLGGPEASLSLRTLMTKRASVVGTTLRARPLEEKIAATRSRNSSLPITPGMRAPSATVCAPVSVDVSIR